MNPPNFVVNFLLIFILALSLNDEVAMQNLGQENQVPLCPSEEELQLDCSSLVNIHKYRTFSGVCNNLRHPYLGAAGTPMIRLLLPIYEDGRNAPVGFYDTVFYNGVRKPNARSVSKNIMSANFTLTNPRLTAMIAHWGQFLAHDLTLAREGEVNCTQNPQDANNCFNLVLPITDQIQRETAIFPFQRSKSCFSQRIDQSERDQLNQVTSFIDGSQIYGSNERLSNILRDYSSDKGRLRINSVYQSATGKAYLPFHEGQNQRTQCHRNPRIDGVNCFLGGDIRTNEQLMLTVLHTIAVREHNRIAENLAKINPHWNGETLFQESRKILIGILQHVTMHDWLPKLIGIDGMRLMERYPGYDPDEDPSIANAFAAAVMRFGHAIMVPVLERYDKRYRSVPGGHIPLRDAFFAPEILIFDGGMDPLLRGAIFSPLKEIMGRSLVNAELTEHLFPHAHRFPLDLASLNIQRGRDHALPSYNKYRRYCGLPEIFNWIEFAAELRDPAILPELITLYSTPRNIDLWVGGLLERPLTDSLLGSTFSCILINQFRRVRDADRFWYENEDVFTPEQLEAIRRYSLAKLVCNNADDIERIQPDIFAQNHNLRSCSSLLDFDLRPWRDIISRQRDVFRERRELVRPPFECATPKCACRYRPGQWSNCDPVTEVRIRFDELVAIHQANYTCPRRKRVIRSCSTIRPPAVSRLTKLFEEFETEPINKER